MSDSETKSESSSDVTTAREWRSIRKLWTVAVVASFAFLSTFGSSIITPGREDYKQQFKISTEVSVLPLALYNFGLAIGVTLGAPASEVLGRQRLFLICMPCLLIFIMGCGFSNDLASLLACRFFAGVFASVGSTIPSATISDLYAPGRSRAAGLCIYYAMPFSGAVVGPFVGFFVVNIFPWQWTQWVYLFIAVPIVAVGLLVLRETKESVLRKQHEETADQEKNDSDQTTEDKEPTSIRSAAMSYIRNALFRPIHMLCTELIVALVCAYAGFNFGLLFCMVTIFPDIFKAVYGFGYVAQALCFIGMIVGCLVGPPLLLLDDRYIRTQDTEDMSSVTKPPPPETRLRGAMFGGICLPIGLFWFGWTAQSGVSYLSPIFASALITLGGLCVYISTSAYIIEVYGPAYAASANGASSMVRYTMAGIVPLFTIPMYNGLGVGWATSLLGFGAALLMPIPWIFARWGHRLRERCGYKTAQDDE